MIGPFLIRTAAGRAAIRFAQGAVALLLPRRVLRGPFRGTRIHRNTFGSAFLPKLLGTYEAEIAADLHQAISDARADAFIDVGCAGGFYLQAVSHVRQDIDLIGIDINPKAARVAGRNVVRRERLTIWNKKAELADIIAACKRYRRPVVLIDIEGGERALLSEACPGVGNAVFIVEVHEYLGVRPEALARSLEATHQVTLVPFGHYGLTPTLTSVASSPVQLFLRHELRHPGTSYLLAHPRS